MELRPDPARKLSANLYDIPLLCVQWKTPDDGQRNCPKHVEFYSKNKFEKLVHLIGFIIRKTRKWVPNQINPAHALSLYFFTLHIDSILLSHSSS